MKSALQNIIAIITARPNYDKHLVLDGGKHVIMVKDIESNLYLFRNNKWESLTNQQAQVYAERYYHYNSFLSLLTEDN